MTKNLLMPVITMQAAAEIASKVKGTPSEGRVLVAIPDSGQGVTAGGIIIPGQVEDYQKRGVIIQRGYIEEKNPFIDTLQVGSIVTYGDFAGKKIEVSSLPELPGISFVVLSINEIAYIEPNE